MAFMILGHIDNFALLGYNRFDTSLLKQYYNCGVRRMGRMENIAIFEDTDKLCRTNATLKKAIDESLNKQILVLEKTEYPSHRGAHRFDTPASIVISQKRSYEAAASYCDAGLKVCVHNFASAGNPGGGVTSGAGAQEECLCRCSTLYPNLNSTAMWDGFYGPHRKNRDPLHNDDCIYTPGVIVFKSDEYMPKLLQEKEWYTVNVLTCAAPNLRDKPSNQYNPADGNEKATVSKTELQRIHEKRLRRICDIACENGDEAIILGAFGCGAFSNPPEIVAAAAKTVVKEYLYCFKKMEFAVYCRRDNTENYDVFKRQLAIIR